MFFIMISLAVSLLIVIFALQNSVIVPINFFTWSTDVPLVLIIFISAFAGAIIIFCLALWKDMKRRFKSVSVKASGKASELKGKATDYKEKGWLNKVKSEEQKTSPTKADSSTDLKTPASAGTSPESDDNSKSNLGNSKQD